MTGRERFEAGDGIRGLACLAIVVWHALAFTLFLQNREYATPRLGADGRPIAEAWPQAGVEALVLLSHTVFLFFALSGYLIARPFVAAYVAGRRAPSVRRYAWNRVIRIVPVMWVVTALTLLAYGPGGDGLAQILAVFGFVQMWLPGELAREIPQAWTLNVEVGFYLALPLAAVVLWRLPRPATAQGRQRVVLALVALATLASTAFIWRLSQGGLSAWRGTTPGLLAAYGVAFAPGLLLAALEPTAPGWLRARPRAGAAAVAAMAALVVASAVAVGVIPPDQPLRERLALATFGGAVVAVCLVHEWRGRTGWAQGRIATWLGVRSYSIYVVHLLVLFAVIDLLDRTDLSPGWAGAVAVAAGVPLVLLATWVLHAVVEAPTLRLRRSPAVTSRAPTVAAAAPPPASSSASPRSARAAAGGPTR